MGMAFGALRGVLLVALTVLLLREFTLVAQDKWWKTLNYSTCGDFGQLVL